MRATRIPASATFLQKLILPPLRNFAYFMFTYLPYAPVRRVNKPALSGAYIWASSHSNFLCDAFPAAFEGPCTAKFLAKSTLFVFPIKRLMGFCGALPLARAQDLRTGVKKVRVMQNRSTFKAATAALKDGWPIAIYPEGVSIVAPGLVLPLRAGVAKLAFSAEEAHKFSLGLKIIPVGLEYGSRRRVGSGLHIRYGQPIVLKEFEHTYRESRELAVAQVMERLTAEMVKNFPHFRDESASAVGKKLVTLGICRTKHQAAQIFLNREKDPAFWPGLEARMRAFDECTKGSRIPLPAWGHRRAWKELGPERRGLRYSYLLLGLPFALLDLLNNTLATLLLNSIADYLAVDETEIMTKRFFAAWPVLGVVYALQFWFLTRVAFPRGKAGLGTYFAYALGSCWVWYVSVHWRRQLKRVGSLFFFKRAGVTGRSKAVSHYRALRQYLSQLQHHG